MNKGLIFLTGVAIGTITTWKIVKEYYKQKNQEDIASVIETFRNRNKTEKVNGDTEDFSDLEKSQNIAEKEGYIDYTNFFNSTVDVNKNEENIDDEIITTTNPYPISPDDFGEFDDYGNVGLLYYNDGVLVEDMTNDVIDDIDNIIGRESLKHVGEYEDDVLYVRNDELKTDYEVIFKNENYAELED